MKAEEWEPYYSEILDFFGFSREDDEHAAHVLAELLPRDDIAALRETISGHDCIVCGNAPSLADEIRKTDFSGKVIIAADAAARVLFHAILVLHAHGDNIPLVRSWVPKVRGPIVGTTQATPLAHVYNFGGFSDGDRCVFCAYELGAANVSLIGFDLDDRSVDPVKRGKLMIARKLLKLCGHDV